MVSTVGFKSVSSNYLATFRHRSGESGNYSARLDPDHRPPVQRAAELIVQRQAVELGRSAVEREAPTGNKKGAVLQTATTTAQLPSTAGGSSSPHQRRPLRRHGVGFAADGRPEN